MTAAQVPWRPVLRRTPRYVDPLNLRAQVLLARR